MKNRFWSVKFKILWCGGSFFPPRSFSYQLNFGFGEIILYLGSYLVSYLGSSYLGRYLVSYLGSSYIGSYSVS